MSDEETKLERNPEERNLEVVIPGGDIVQVDLENLDPNPSEIIELLTEAPAPVPTWISLCLEYWKQGYRDAAESIAVGGRECFSNPSLPQETRATVGPLLAFLASVQLARARDAPKVTLKTAREDILDENTKTKMEYHAEAARYLNQADANFAQTDETLSSLSVLTRGVHLLATRSMEDAMRSFETILGQKPTNVIALLGKARILYTRRQYSQALQLFRQVLRYNPQCRPDPRIGIGLCLWQLGQHEGARMAWERSMEVNPQDNDARLLLGIIQVNRGRDESTPEGQRGKALQEGSVFVQKAFQANPNNASAANALGELFMIKNNTKRALKLAERTIQYSDTLTILTEGYVRAGRCLHADGANDQAMQYFNLALEGQPKNVLASLGLAQMQLKKNELPAAIHTIDTLIQPPNPQRTPQALAMLASLRSFPRPGVSSSEIGQERARARELFDRAVRDVDSHAPTQVSRALRDDLEMHVEMARLWQGENIERAFRSLAEALRVSEGQGKVDPRLLNNLGVMHQLEGRLPEARSCYEKSLTSVSSLGSDFGEMSTSILYNLARVYEEQEEDTLAKDAYEKLLSRHPEYVDAKIRQAQMLSKINRHNDAHDLLKQSLASQNSNLNLRAFYTHFLIATNLPKVAKEFVFVTLKDHDKHDVYSLCAAGWIQYHQARESRDSSAKGMDERRKGFQRSAEFYEKALHLDPQCAVAAQGLAIAIAEDALGALSGHAPAAGADEVQKRIKNSRDALDIFAKVRESINDGSVYANMGHCYYARDEFDRAIESYETASKLFYRGHSVSVLLCLCRSWYAKANKDQSYPAMKTALQYAQSAYHLQPSDLAVMYNVAMIQQKSVEMLFALPPPKRSSSDLQRVIDQAQNAQSLFASLAANKSPVVPYSRDIADQRRKYGETMLRKKDEHLAAQRVYEEETEAKIAGARQRREEERVRLETLERERLEKLRADASALAEHRRLAREQAQEWTREARLGDSEEEKEKRPRKTKKQKAEDDLMIDDTEGSAQPKPKKKRGKLRKNNGGDEDMVDEAAAMATDDEDVEKPSKKKTARKRIVRDDDDEEAVAPKKKQFKSKEMLSDTDDEA